MIRFEVVERPIVAGLGGTNEIHNDTGEVTSLRRQSQTRPEKDSHGTATHAVSHSSATGSHADIDGFVFF